MSNIFRATGQTYFQVPQSLITTGHFQQLGKTAFKLYLWLCFEAQRTSKGTITAPGMHIAKSVGIVDTKVGAARRELEDLNMIETCKAGLSYRYTLCDPTTGLPIQGNSEELARLDFDELSPEQLKLYFGQHLTESRDTENGLSARCPFHDDSNPSLTVSLDSGGAWQCHGCGRHGKLVHFEIAIAEVKGDSIGTREAHRRIIDALRDLGAIDATTGQAEAIYSYTDHMGEVVFEVLRLPGKKFSQRRPHPERPGKYLGNVSGCPTVLYRLFDVIEADVVFVVEGEKDADAIRALELKDDVWCPVAATTNAMGAGRWTVEHAAQLRGKRCILLGDNDHAGDVHMMAVELSLRGIASELVRIKVPKPCKDVSEFLALNGPAELCRLVPDGWLETAF